MTKMPALRPMTAHNNLHSLLFQATSAEYIALCLQTYQLARHALLERLRLGTYRNPAVILDLDETILDNSPYQAWQIAAGTNFHEETSWKAWCDLGAAQAVPGSVEFVRFAVESGVRPIFITSRQTVTRAGTARNLAALQLLSEEELDFETTAHENHEVAFKTRLFMKGMSPVTVTTPAGEKELELRNKFNQRVFCERARGFEIVLSIGDNLSDYAEYYGRVLDANGEESRGQHPTITSRKHAVWQDRQLFGRDFILLPNATYGGWLRAMEANKLGAGDELAYTAEQVREGLKEPQTPFLYEGGTKTETPVGPKLGSHVPTWNGKDAIH
jgi:acid phosphatase